MATKFQIVGDSKILVLTDTTSGDVVFEMPSRDAYFNPTVLLERNEIQLYDTNDVNLKASKVYRAIPLSSAQDEAGVTFTINTWRDWARNNLGFNTASGGSGAEGGLKDVTLILNTDQNVYADQSPGIIDPNGLSGWYFKNDSAGKKVNWYYFNPSVGVDIQLGDLNSLYAIARIHNPNELFFFQVYTRRQFDGNDAGSFYRSRVTYAAYTATPNVTEDYVFWAISDPDVNPSLNDIEMTYDAGTSVGPQDTSEDILFIALSSNSGAALNDVEFTAKNLGVRLQSLHQNILEAVETANVDFYFSEKAELSRVGQTTIPLANTQSLVFEKYLAGQFTPTESGKYNIGSWFKWSCNGIFQNILVQLRIDQTGGGLSETILLEMEAQDSGGTGEIVNVVQAGNIVGNINTGTDQRTPGIIKQDFDLVGGEEYAIVLEWTAPPGLVPTIYDGLIWVEQQTLN